MTCRGTERVFVNPAVCQSASAWTHKPLSAASPLTRGRGGGPPPAPPASAPASCPRRGSPDGDMRGPWGGMPSGGAAPSISLRLGPAAFVGLSFLVRGMGASAAGPRRPAMSVCRSAVLIPTSSRECFHPPLLRLCNPPLLRAPPPLSQTLSPARPSPPPSVTLPASCRHGESAVPS